MPREVLLNRDLYRVTRDLDADELAQLETDLHAARDTEQRVKVELEALIIPKRAELKAAMNARGQLERERATGQRVTVHEIRREWDDVADEVVIIDLADDSELERRPLTPGEAVTLDMAGRRPLDPGPPA